MKELSAPKEVCEYKSCQRGSLRAYHSELGAEDKPLSCYITCTENDKGWQMTALNS